MQDNALEIWNSRAISPETLRALEVLQSGRVPSYAIQSHPGKGGKVFPYISHIWVTRQLNAALPQLWSFDVLDAQIYEEGGAKDGGMLYSVAARATLTINIPLKDGAFLKRTMTEIGSFDGGGGKMSKANMVASAASRALVKCFMRMFNVGSELYAEPELITPKIAWNTLKHFAENQGLTEEQVVTVLKAAGISSDQLVDRFSEAYLLLAQLAGKASASEEVPSGLKGD